MGSKLALEDKGRVKFLDKRRQRHECIDAMHSKPYSCSILIPPQQQGPKSKEKLIEFFCSSCLLCVCCPLVCVCCFIKLPCRICKQALKCAWEWTCYGSKNKMFAEYSSFSDIDSDVTSGNIKHTSVSEDKTYRLQGIHVF